MKKKHWFWIILLGVVITVIVLVKVYPLWASLSSLVAFLIGGVGGWWGKMFYDKYIKE